MTAGVRRSGSAVIAPLALAAGCLAGPARAVEPRVFQSERHAFRVVVLLRGSGMAFYDGAQFPRWRANLFVGALAARTLVRLELDGEHVVREERLLQGALGRIRDVRSGPDGYLYILTDASNGVLARLEPVQP